MSSNALHQFGGSELPYPREYLHVPQWYALRTRSRSEKQVLRLLDEAEVEADGAIAEVERQWSDRTRRVGLPLFPGYVFARFPLLELNTVLSTYGVATVVRTNGAPTPIREEEMESVRCLARGVSETGTLPTPQDYLEPGQPIAVVEGPFKGMKGVLTELRGRHRVAVKLPAIRQAMAVELDRGWLAPV